MKNSRRCRTQRTGTMRNVLLHVPTLLWGPTRYSSTRPCNEFRSQLLDFGGSRKPRSVSLAAELLQTVVDPRRRMSARVPTEEQISPGWTVKPSSLFKHSLNSAWSPPAGFEAGRRVLSLLIVGILSEIAAEPAALLLVLTSQRRWLLSTLLSTIFDPIRKAN